MSFLLLNEKWGEGGGAGSEFGGASHFHLNIAKKASSLAKITH